MADPTAKPTGRVGGITLTRGNGTSLTAKWKVPSGLTNSKNTKRATALTIEWRVTRKWKGEKPASASAVLVKTSKVGIGTTQSTFNCRDFTDDKGHVLTNSDYYPNANKPFISSVQVRVYARNKKGTADVYRSKSWGWERPHNPAITPLEHNLESGEVFFTITAFDDTKAGVKHKHRSLTHFQVKVEDTRTGITDTSREDDFSGDSKAWDENTPDQGKIIVDVTDRYLLSEGQYVRVTVTAYSKGVRGNSGLTKSGKSSYAKRTIVFAYPNAATIEAVRVDNMNSNFVGGVSPTGIVMVELKTNTDYNTSPTTGITLEKLVSSDATTPAQATADANWADTTAVDDGECVGLALSVAELMPTRGKHTWVRTKSWNQYDTLFYRYSEPVEVTELYVDPAAASDNLTLIDLHSGDDGTSLIALAGWVDGQDPDTGTELSWSSDIHAWESTKEPETYELTRNDGAIAVGVVTSSKITYDNAEYTVTNGSVTIGTKSYKVVPLETNVTPVPATALYDGSQTVYIQGLEQGTTYYVRGRRYLEVEDGDTSYGGYSNQLNSIPVSSPSSVVLMAPSSLPTGSDLSVSWTYDSDATQTEWHLLYGNEYTIVDQETYQREYSIDEGAPLASGNDALGSALIPWDRLQSRLDENGEIGLAVRMGTGGSLVTSDVVIVRVVEPPVMTLSVSPTVTDQPVDLSVTCNVDATLAVVIRAEDAGNSGDGLVHQDQTGGDVVWQDYFTPNWSLSNGVFTATVHTPEDPIELLDNGNYVITAQPTDTVTGLVGETVTTGFSVTWAEQAPRMEDDEHTTDITVTPSDTIDEDGVRTRKCVIQLTAPYSPNENDTYNVYRVTPDGTYLIAEGMALDAEVTDYYAPYGGDGTAYRVAIVTDNGDVDWNDYEYFLPGRDLRIDFGGEYIELPWDLTLNDGYTKDFEARQKLDGGVDGYWNEAVTRKGGFTSNLIRVREQSKAAAIRRLAQYSGPVFVRTPDGCAYQADVQVSSIGGARRDAALAVTLDATEVNLTEAFMATIEE